MAFFNSVKHLIWIAGIIITLCNLASCSPLEIIGAEKKGCVNKGRLDVYECDANRNTVISLNGEWEFYWKKIYTPETYPRNTLSNLVRYRQLSGPWNGSDYYGEKITSKGYGTLRLVMQSVEPGVQYDFYIKDMGAAYRLYANGSLIASNEDGGGSYVDKKPQFMPDVAFYTPTTTDIELILQVLGFHEKYDGPTNQIYFGKDRNLIAHRIILAIIDIFLIGTLFSIGLYHCSIFFLRRREFASLAFGAFCFIYALRTALLGERLFSFFFPGCNWEVVTMVEYLTVYIGFPVFIQYVYYVLREEFSLPLIRGFQFISLIFVIIAISTPGRIHTAFLPLFQVVVIAFSIYLLMILSRAIWRKHNDALFLLVGFSFFFVMILNDFSYIKGTIYTGYYSSLGVIMFSLMQSYILSRRFTRAFSRAELLAISLRDERDQFESKVEERTAQLLDAYEKLKDLDRLKSDFFANISHEIRTPLTLILSPVECALQESESDVMHRDLLTTIYSNGRRLLKLINNILDFSKIEAGKMSFSPCPSDIGLLIELFVANARAGAESKGLSLLFTNNTPGLVVMLDHELFEKAMYNLLSNAIKFTPSGGQVAVDLASGGGSVKVTVKDTGIGIPPHKIGTIFERFVQVDTSSTRSYEGTGIGLSIVKEIARLHKGDVTVTSDPGSGSTFILELPMIDYPETSNKGDGTHALNGSETFSADTFLWEQITGQSDALQSRSVPTIDNDAGTALVVEDNSDMLNLLAKIVGGEYRVLTAQSGLEAINLLNEMEVPPDIVVSDIMMPVMDGYELVERIRSDPRYEGMPIILLTAKTGVEMKLKGFGTGATDYIVKPFNARELLARMRAQIDMKLLRDRLVRLNKELYRKLELKTKKDGPVSLATEEKIEQVIEFIKEHCTDDISRDGIASAVGMSPDYLSRSFNKITGKRIDDYLNEQRIEVVKKLLSESNQTIITIAYSAGFDNLRTFNKSFMKFAGCTPSEYRKNARGIKGP